MINGLVLLIVAVLWFTKINGVEAMRTRGEESIFRDFVGIL